MLRLKAMDGNSNIPGPLGILKRNLMCVSVDIKKQENKKNKNRIAL